MPSLTRTARTAQAEAGSARYPLTSGWRFGAYEPGAETVSYDDRHFAAVSVPHSVVRLSWRDWNPAAWQGVWVYRRHLPGASLLSGARPGDRVFVHFDGVMVNATVVCNDRVAGSHRGGYLPFSTEITAHLTRGDNVLAVIVDSRCLQEPPVVTQDAPGRIDFMQPGGIYRDAAIEVVPSAFISDVFARPAQVLTARPRVDVRCTIDATLKAAATLRVELLDGTRSIASRVRTLRVASPGIVVTSLSLTGLGPVRLWSPGRPALYTVRATLTVRGAGEHVATRRIGFREAAFKADGFYLNGRRLQLFGLNRHQLYPYAGLAMPARVQRRDAEILRNDFNCNMVRCSHYPQSPHFLDACDELGLLVWQEAPGWGQVSNDRAWQDLVIQNVKDMVVRDRSRPSVIVWGTRLNETANYPSLWAATRAAARELDPSRPSAGAMTLHADGRRDWAEDVFGFNDYRLTARGDATLLPPLPGVPYLITESVGVLVANPKHFTWTDPPAQLARQAALHAQAHNVAGSDRRYCGLLAWAGFDYLSLMGQPGSVKWAGVADGFRVPKPGAAVYQAQADPRVRPVIAPVFFWELGDAQPVASRVMIASNCERLEVFVDGGHVVTARPEADSPLYRHLAHPPFLVSLPAPAGPSELLIRGYAGGRPVAQLKMSSDPAGDHLAMTADDPAITADGSDATRVVFRALDAHGNQRRYQAGRVDLTLDGPGELIGDNPFAFGEYGGLGAVWVRSLAGQPGSVSVSAAHPVLGQAQVQIQSR